MEIQFGKGTSIYQDIAENAGTVTITLPDYRYSFNGFNFKSTTSTGDIVFSEIYASTINEVDNVNALAVSLMAKGMSKWPTEVLGDVTKATTVSDDYVITLGNKENTDDWACGAGWWLPIWVSNELSNPFDCSNYTKFIVRFTEPVAQECGFSIVYGKRKEGSQTEFEDNGSNQWVAVSAGTTEIVASLDASRKSCINAINFGGPDNAVIKIADAYFANDKFVRFNKAATSTISAVTGAYVELERPLKAGWNSVCLPFATNVSSIAADAQLYEFTAATASTITLTKKDNGEMAANTPYFVKLSAAISDPIVFSNVDIVAGGAGTVTNNGLTLHGNYEAAMSMVDKYGVAGGAIKKGVTGSTLPAFSAYFDGTFAAREFSIFTDDETTGISSMQAEPAQVFDNQYYNLNGQRISQPTKGLYIRNGKKYIVK